MPRHDPRSTGLAESRGALDGPPQVLARYPLGGRVLGPKEVWVTTLPRLGTVVVYLTNGRAVMADTRGAEIWRTPLLALSQIVTVADLDGDGVEDVVASSVGNSGPGSLVVLAATTGEVEFTYPFAGGELGVDRDRSTLLSLDGGKTQSLIAAVSGSRRVWAFDFSRGVPNGRIHWQSADLSEHVPDSRPLVLDGGGAGTPEIALSCEGVLLLLDAENGTELARLAFQTSPTFGGFFAARDLGGSGSTDLVRVSASSYLKDLTVFSRVRGAFKIKWQQTLESGLGSQRYTLEPSPGLVDLKGDGKAEIVASVGSWDKGSYDYRLVVWDAWTGGIEQEIEGLRLASVVSTVGGGVLVFAYRGKELVALAPVRGQLEVGSRLGEATLAVQGTFDGVPAEQSFVLIIRETPETSKLVALSVSPRRGLKEIWTLPIPEVGTPIRICWNRAQGFSLVSSSNGETRLIDAAGHVKGMFHIGGYITTPVVGRLDDRGTARILVVDGSSRLHCLSRRQETIAEEWRTSRIATPTGEGFNSLMLADLENRGTRQVVAFRQTGTERWLVVLDAQGKELWRHLCPASHWEQLVTVGHLDDPSRLGVLFKDSEGVTALDGESGVARWHETVSGECQRTLSVADLDGDGGDDLITQAGAQTWALRCSDGRVLWRGPTSVTYGSHTALAFSGGSLVWPSAALVEAGTGAIATRSLVDGGVRAAQQLQVRGTESRPVVLADVDGDGIPEVAQAGGDGILRVLKVDGTLLYERDLGTPVPWPMTAADIDGDGRPEFLVGTASGDLLALRGHDGSVLWRVHFDAPVATAVPADVNGDGNLEIVVSVGDGNMYVLGAGHHKISPQPPVEPAKPAQPVRPLPAPGFALNQQIGEWILLGYDTDEKRLAQGEPVTVTLQWVAPPKGRAIANALLEQVSVTRRLQTLPDVRTLVPGGDFETGLAGFPEDIYGLDGSPRSLTQDVRGGQTTHVALLENSATRRQSSLVSKPVPVLPGHLYLQAGWIRTEGGQAFLGRQWLPSGLYGYVVGDFTAASWTHVARVVEAPAGTTSAQVWLLNFHSQGRVFFDDASFVDLGESVTARQTRGVGEMAAGVAPSPLR